MIFHSILESKEDRASRFNNITRRHFLRVSSLATGAAFLGFPHLLGGKDEAKKLRVALIGVGFQGRVRLSEVLQCGVPVTALCDVDEESLAKAKNMLVHEKRELPQTFLDYRELLSSSVDAVVIATPDHWHAPVAMAALRAGKHVFCEKPLTHTISEARDLRQLARQFPQLSTQMGNQGSASLFMRRGIEIVQAGGIGQVREVHIWAAPSHSFQSGQNTPQGEDPIPAGLHWDNWIGVAPFRPYKKGEYHPRAWRAWYDFGGGSIADWGCHGFNFPYRSLNLDYPTRIEPIVTGSYTDGYPDGVALGFEFASRGALPPVTIWWYDGGRKPESDQVPKSLVEHYGEIPDSGCLLLGEKGFTFGNPHSGVEYIQLKGESKLSGIIKHAATAGIPQSLPRAKGHVAEWITACNGGPATFSNFEIGGHLTEIVLTGVVALRAKKTLVWNGPGMRAENAPELEKFIQAHYRPGWG